MKKKAKPPQKAIGTLPKVQSQTPEYHKVSVFWKICPYTLCDLPLGLFLLPAASEIEFANKGPYTDTYLLKILEVIDF